MRDPSLQWVSGSSGVKHSQNLRPSTQQFGVLFRTLAVLGLPWFLWITRRNKMVPLLLIIYYNEDSSLLLWSILMALYSTCTVPVPSSVAHPVPLDPSALYEPLAACHFCTSLANFAHQSLPAIMSHLVCVFHCLNLINNYLWPSSTSKSHDSQMFCLFT